VAGACGLLYALGAKAGQHIDTGEAALAAPSESRCGTRRTINPILPDIANPL
jgi:hypothetical protein